jgi:hypothetical protein
MSRALTDSNNIGDSSELAEVELSGLDLLAASGETDGNGSGVGSSEADDTDTGESVEGSGGTEVDDTEDDLDDHAEHHSVEGNVELGVDLGPPLGTGDSTITGESPDTSRRGSCAADTTDDGQDDEGEEKTESAAGAANCALEDQRHGLS